MVNANDDKAGESRPPSLADLTTLCRLLNQSRVEYIVIGGMAMIEAGYVRATEDIDLLVEASQANQQRIRSALMELPDQAIREVTEGDFKRYAVIRVADEFVVDLMTSACGVQYPEAKASITYREIESVRIPFASPSLLWKLKQTRREKDNLDLLFLKELLKK